MTNQYLMDELLLTAYAEEDAPVDAPPAGDAPVGDAPSDGDIVTTTGDPVQTESSGGGGGGSSTVTTIVIMVLMVAVFYFLLIRPQRKKDKAVKSMLSALKVGDRICTIGGIYGTIIAMKEDTITLAVGAEKNPVVMARWAIRSVEDAPLENDSELTP